MARRSGPPLHRIAARFSPRKLSRLSRSKGDNFNFSQRQGNRDNRNLERFVPWPISSQSVSQVRLVLLNRRK